jgi:hypothetical protein
MDRKQVTVDVRHLDVRHLARKANVASFHCCCFESLLMVADASPFARPG